MSKNDSKAEAKVYVADKNSIVYKLFFNARRAVRVTHVEQVTVKVTSKVADVAKQQAVNARDAWFDGNEENGLFDRMMDAVDGLSPAEVDVVNPNWPEGLKAV